MEHPTRGHLRQFFGGLTFVSCSALITFGALLDSGQKVPSWWFVIAGLGAAVGLVTIFSTFVWPQSTAPIPATPVTFQRHPRDSGAAVTITAKRQRLAPDGTAMEIDHAGPFHQSKATYGLLPLAVNVGELCGDRETVDAADVWRWTFSDVVLVNHGTGVLTFVVWLLASTRELRVDGGGAVVVKGQDTSVHTLQFTQPLRFMTDAERLDPTAAAGDEVVLLLQEVGSKREARLHFRVF